MHILYFRQHIVVMQFVRRDSVLRFSWSVSEINKGKCKFYHCCLDKGRKQTNKWIEDMCVHSTPIFYVVV